MNNTPTVKIEGSLDRDAIRIIRDIPGIELDVHLRGDRRADAIIRVGDVSLVVEVKAQRETNASSARQLAEYARTLPGQAHLLLVTGATTELARQLLEEANVAVIDGLGHVRVSLPGLFIWTDGRPEDKPAGHQTEQPPTRLTGKAGIAAQALMREPERLWKVHDLAQVASISAGLAHRVLARLERENLVEAEGSGPQRTRRLSDPAALLDLWSEEMRDRKTRQLRAFRLTRDAMTQASALSKALDAAGIEHAVTGPAAAARLAPFTTAIPVTDVWVTETVTMDRAATLAGAEVVPEGHNVLLRQAAGDGPLTFRERVDDVWTVSKFRLYYDLRNDPRRGREQANRLREEIIRF